MISKIRFVPAVLVAIVSISIGSVMAGPVYTFDVIPDLESDPIDAAIGETQMSVEVIDFAPGVVHFRFTNVGPAASSITDIYFDDDASLLTTPISFESSSGVSFSAGAAPPNLSRGENISFEATTGLLADSDDPVQPNGINPGEWLTVILNLEAGKSFANVIAAMDLAAETMYGPMTGNLPGHLRIGIRVQGYASEGSESFVNDGPGVEPGPTSGVPEPASLALLALGSIGLGGFGLRRRKANAA